MRLRACGDAALLVDVASPTPGPAGGRADALGSVLALHAALRADPPPGAVDLVPAATTVLVRLRPGADPAPASAHVLGVAARTARPADGGGPAEAGAVLEVPVVYDGPDLEEAAAALGTDPSGLVARHTARPWTAAFAGFAPGFAYCVQDGPPAPGSGPAQGGDGAGDGPGDGPGADGAGWDVPRRASPRTAVPAGSVALAGPFSGVYPRRAPGGWQLVGRTDARLWDADREPPALLPPGARVRFVDVGGGPRPAGAS
ncbi:allophanate hydrolase subunit 1 [uncultured Pseudokineococcus sp.]|uniref:5-oxoprolinase subunit B family protein n=1 Tax=uncultured Pseudokineococcus sp. TaxID=1642928 RepID=UPI00342B5B97